MTLTTWDDALCKIVEPGVCPTSRRFQVLKEFQKAGIPTVVWLTPILPYINDTMVNLQALLECCVDAGVRGVLWFGAGVTLRDGNREYFYQQLDRQFPGMKEQYRKEFGNSYVAASRNDRQLSAMVKDTCGRYGILSEPDRVFAELQRFEEKEGGEQLSFLL